MAILQSANPLDLTHERAMALLDTGATKSAISPAIIRKLGLQSYTKKALIVATEQRLVDFYTFRIGVFPHDSHSPEGPVFPYILAETEGFGMHDKGDFDAIIGMDVIKHCDLALYRSGRWQIKF